MQIGQFARIAQNYALDCPKLSEKECFSTKLDFAANPPRPCEAHAAAVTAHKNT